MSLSSVNPGAADFSFDPNLCANCNSAFSGRGRNLKVTRFSITEKVGKEQKEVSVAETINHIFLLPPWQQIKDRPDMGCCSLCAPIVAQLYKLHIKLEDWTRATSVIGRIVMSNNVETGTDSSDGRTSMSPAPNPAMESEVVPVIVRTQSLRPTETDGLVTGTCLTDFDFEPELGMSPPPAKKRRPRPMRTEYNPNVGKGSLTIGGNITAKTAVSARPELKLNVPATAGPGANILVDGNLSVTVPGNVPAQSNLRLGNPPIRTASWELKVKAGLIPMYEANLEENRSDADWTIATRNEKAKEDTTSPRPGSVSERLDYHGSSRRRKQRIEAKVDLEWDSSGDAVEVLEVEDESPEALAKLVEEAVQEHFLSSLRDKFRERRYTGKCSVCDIIFDAASCHHVIIHFKKTHRRAPVFICNMCGASLRVNVMNLAAHYQTHGQHFQNENLQTTCGMNLDSIPVQKPLRSQYNKKLSKEELERWRAQRRKAKVFQRPCPICAFPVSTRKPYHLRNHIARAHHSPPTQLTCSTCGRPFQNKQKLRNHEMTHLGFDERSNCLCQICGKEYKSLGSLAAHIRHGHVPAQARQRLRCTVENCDFTALMKISLKRHMKTVHRDDGEFEYTCDRCGDGFNLKRLYVDHTLICCDPTERPHPCLSCNKRFKFKQNVVSHLVRTHNYVPEQARTLIYPGLTTPKWVDKDYSRNHRKRQTKRVRRKRKKLTDA